MKWLVSFLLVLGLASASTESASVADSHGAKVSPAINIACLIENCLLPIGSCVLDSTCRTALTCSKKCFDLWDNDTTSEKYIVQNCTNICAFSYGEEASYARIMTCAGDNKCTQFPPIPSQCRAPGNLTLLKKLPSEILEGDWWVLKGKHPVYDCYPCQRVHFKRINASSFLYTPNYQVYLANGSLHLVEDQHFLFPNTTPGANVTMNYQDIGLSHTETWWLFDAADDKSYVVLYYCGNTMQWFYDGALVVSKEKTLTDADYTKIKASFERAVGLDSTKFCTTKTNPCPQP